MKTQLKNLVNRLKNKIQSWAARAICLSGIHTMPRWKQAGWGNEGRFYYGECRNCTKRLTPGYSYSEGPLLDGIRIYGCDNHYVTDKHIKTKHNHRNIDSIIKACINMFLKDQPTNQPL